MMRDNLIAEKRGFWSIFGVSSVHKYFNLSIIWTTVTSIHVYEACADDYPSCSFVMKVVQTKFALNVTDREMRTNSLLRAFQ